MTRFNIILLYLALSAINGLVPSVITSLLSASGMMAFIVWGLVTSASFVLICMICLGRAMEQAVLETKQNSLGREFNEAVI